MSTLTPESVALRLTTTSSLLLERSRVLSLNLKPSPSSTQQIVRNLTGIRTDLERLASEGEDWTKGKGREGGEEELGERYDRLVEMLEEDEVGREKAKPLRRDVKRLGRVEREGEQPRFSVEPPTPPMVSGPFRDDPFEDPSPLDPHELLSQQQMMMNDQDERLNLLSHSIGRQNDLSIQIGSELDIHHELLEETDSAMDHTAASLGRARRRLDRVAGEAKRHGGFGLVGWADRSHREHHHHHRPHRHTLAPGHCLQDVIAS
nr:syntaxin 8 [Cryptococcus depauperatus CBS 7855]